MSMFLWWLGDAVLILVVLPLITVLLLRIIKALQIGHLALVSISQSSRSITTSLPGGMTELSETAQAAARLQPRKTPTRG